MNDAPEVLQRYARVAAEVMRHEFVCARCVNGSRVTIDVLRKFGVECVPVSVMCFAGNRLYMERVNKLGRLPSGAEMDVWIRDGAWALGVDLRPDALDAERNQWNGHLVVVTRAPDVAGYWLIDSAALQMHRLQRGIVVPDVFVGPVPRRFFVRAAADQMFELADGAKLYYRVEVGDRRFETLPGFQRHECNLRVAEDIAGRMRRSS